MTTKNVCCRTGFGFDSHAFGKKGTLVLGGVVFSGVPALAGHSDGDALLHAVIDALLGAAGLGDIGELFPDTSATFKGISSRVMLRETVATVRKAGFAATHVDVTVLADRPKVTPAKQEIRRVLTSLLGLPESGVNIKAKTAEGLHIFKGSGGVAVWAVATIRENGIRKKT
jgi:2-C-methyl-D-erythritol 2,4-cyclodiphosphate synthase